MLKLDFVNKDYSLEEVINTIIDNDIDNIKRDKDFLDFIISYSLGNMLIGENADKYKEYAKYNGILKLMRLDEYGYFGKKLYKIYEICNKNKITFMETCNLIGEYSIKHILEKESIDINLKLKKPVPFIDHSIILSDGTKPDFNPIKKYNPYNLNNDQEDEYYYELERSFRHRINKSIKGNGDDIELFDEMLSFKEKEKLEKEEAERKRVKDDYEIPIKNLYYGYELYDLSGGMLNMCMKLISWFEYTEMKIGKYNIFRSVPNGEYFLVDDNGKLYIPDKNINFNQQTFGPNTPIREVRIANLPDLLNYNLEMLENSNDNNEMEILEIKNLMEFFENKEKIEVQGLNEYESIIRSLYENLAGDIFSTDNNEKKDGNIKK